MGFRAGIRAWQPHVIASFVLACGPVVTDAVDTDASTSLGTSSSTGADDVLDTGPNEVTTSIADTSSTGGSVSTTGEPVIPGCEAPGRCEDACVQWEEIVESASGSWIEQIAIAPDGTILAIEARQAKGGKAGSSFLRGFDAAGEALFEALVFSDNPDAPLRVDALAVSSDGVIAMVKTETLDGQSLSYWASLDVRTPDGAPYWGSALGTDMSTIGEAVAFGEDGSIVVGGRRNQSVVFSGFLVAYDGSGESRWERESDDLGLDNGSVTAIASSSANDFVLAGWVGAALWLGGIDLDGNVLWTMTEPGDAALTHDASDIAVSVDGDVLVVGGEGDGSGYPVPWFGRFAADGSPQLSIAYAEIAKGPHGLDEIEVTADGRIFVAGIRVNDSGGTSRHVLELGCDGTPAWEWTHMNPPEYDYGNGGGLAWAENTGLSVGGSDYIGTDFTRRGFVARLVP